MRRQRVELLNLKLKFLIWTRSADNKRLLNLKLKFWFGLHAWLTRSRLYHKSCMRTGSLPSMLYSPCFEDCSWVISYLETIFTLESRVDLTQTDRIVLPLDYIKRRLVNMRDEAKTDTVLSQLQQVADNILDERHQDKNREGHFRGHSTQTADTWKTYFLNREQTLTFLLEKGFKVPVMAQFQTVSTQTFGDR